MHSVEGGGRQGFSSACECGNAWVLEVAQAILRVVGEKSRAQGDGSPGSHLGSTRKGGWAWPLASTRLVPDAPIWQCSGQSVVRWPWHFPHQSLSRGEVSCVLCQLCRVSLAVTLGLQRTSPRPLTSTKWEEWLWNSTAQTMVL